MSTPQQRSQAGAEIFDHMVRQIELEVKLADKKGRDTQEGRNHLLRARQVKTQLINLQQQFRQVYPQGGIARNNPNAANARNPNQAGRMPNQPQAPGQNPNQGPNPNANMNAGQNGAQNIGQMGQLGQMGQMNQLGQMNQMNQMNQMGQMNQMNQMGQMNQMNQMNAAQQQKPGLQGRPTVNMNAANGYQQRFAQIEELRKMMTQTVAKIDQLEKGLASLTNPEEVERSQTHLQQFQRRRDAIRQRENLLMREMRAILQQQQQQQQQQQASGQQSQLQAGQTAAQGAQGGQGVQGAQGGQGVQGMQGAQGTPGAPGAPGAHGAQGAQAAQIAQAAQAAQGVPGAQGIPNQKPPASRLPTNVPPSQQAAQQLQSQMLRGTPTNAQGQPMTAAQITAARNAQLRALQARSAQTTDQSAIQSAQGVAQGPGDTVSGVSGMSGVPGVQGVPGMTGMPGMPSVPGAMNAQSMAMQVPGGARTLSQSLPIPNNLNVMPPLPAAMRAGRPTLTNGGPTDAQALNTPGMLKTPALELGGDRLLSKRKLHDLVSSVVGPDNEPIIDGDVKEMLLDLADEFVSSVTDFACKIAKHRKCDVLEAKDIHLHLERNWNMHIAGYSSDEIRSIRRFAPLPAYQQKLQNIAMSKSVNKQ